MAKPVPIIINATLDSKTSTSRQKHDRLTLKGWDEIKNGEGLPADEIFSYLDTWGASEEI